MCYPKPGPRCGKVAIQALAKADAAYRANPTFDTYKSRRQALDQFNMTTEGIRKLKLAAEAEEDLEKKYQLFEKLEHAQESRRLALAVIKSADKGDVLSEEEVNEQRNQPLPVDPLANTKPIGSGCNLNYMDYTYAIGYDYNSKYFDEDKGYMVYRGLRLKPVDVRAYIADVIGEDNQNAIPQEWIDKVQASGHLERVSLEVRLGYYGEEAYINVPDELPQLVSKLYYSQPNAIDREGALPYARSEGVETSDYTPAQAIKQVSSKNFTALPTALRKRVQLANNVYSHTINLDKVKVPKKMASEGTYDVAAFSKSKGKGIAGVVMQEEDGTYTLISGRKRFDTASASKRKKWNFLVLNRIHPSQGVY